MAGPESTDQIVENTETIRDEPVANITVLAINLDTQRDSFTQFGSRLPSLQPEDHVPSATHGKDAAAISALVGQYRRPPGLTNVSVEGRASLIENLAVFKNVVPAGFAVVSRHALSRYFTGFIPGFHEHLPFLHLPTMSVETTAVELVLAIAAIGAQYCRESDKGLEVRNLDFLGPASVMHKTQLY